MKITMQKDLEVEYEYVPSDQSETRLQRGFEIIFEKILNTQNDKKYKYEHENN